MNFFAGEAYCELHYNGHLASPADAVENEFLRIRLIENYVQSLDAYNFVWIGAYRFDGNDNWTYTTGKPVTFTDWGPGQPNASGDACVFFYGHFPTYLFNWRDLSCEGSESDLPFVCQEN